MVLQEPFEGSGRSAGRRDPLDIPFRIPVEQSRLLHERARRTAPRGVQGAGRYYAPFPVYIRKAHGARLWDVDGNEYVDYHASYGPAVLGYNEPRVRQAVVEAMQDEGVLFSQPHEREVALCETFAELIPYVEKTALHGAGGSDPLYNAARVARAYTGRRLILKFEGGYHGWHDELAVSVRPPLAKVGPADEPTPVPESDGALPELAASIVVAPFNDEAAVERLVAKHRGEIAAIFVEPVVHSCGCLLLKPGFLRFLRQLCDAYGMLLVFDEIITGFRHGLEGAGARQGVHPDLAAFGKAMANGFIIAALAGPQRYMSLVGPEGRVLFSGTYAGHLLSVAAAQKTIEILRTEPVHEKIFRLGNMMADGINAAIRRTGVKAVCYSYGSVWSLYFNAAKVESYRDVLHAQAGVDPRVEIAYRTHLLNNGIYLVPRQPNRGFISYAHTEEDVQRVIDATAAFLDEHASALR
ncbi:MAG: aspartate aminotransferase family protein [Chloroflexi bacterium]|nr:aspartate aminotransferase family protein [Chloroflexota bacterium]